MFKLSWLIVLTFISLSIHAVSDLSIFTEQDVRFCSNVTQTSNAGIHPHTLADNGSVWRVGNRRWSDEWEKKFSLWVKDEVSSDFFVKYNIKTDCADAAIAIRTIFARIHHLPVLYAGGTHGNHEKVWHFLSTRKNWNESNWKQNLKEDKRFRSALYRWMGNVGTINLQGDTYQIEVRNPADTTRMSSYVTEGAVLLTSGHTRFISDIDTLRWFPIKQLESTSGRKVRNLSEQNLSLYYPPANEERKTGRGVLKWNWVVNCGKGKFNHVPDWKMPGYSTEQERLRKIYQGIHHQYPSLLNEIARSRMLTNPTRNDVIEFIKMTHGLVEDRIGIVEEGHEAAQANPQAIMDVDGALYDAHSTPSRDKRLLAQYRLIIKISEEKMVMGREDIAAELMKQGVLELSNGMKTTSWHFVSALLEKQASSEPWDDVNKRWGIDHLENRLGVLDAIIKEYSRTTYADIKDRVADIEEAIKSQERRKTRNLKWLGFSFYPGSFLMIFSRFFVENSVSAADQMDVLKYEKENLIKQRDMAKKNLEGAKYERKLLQEIVEYNRSIAG